MYFCMYIICIDWRHSWSDAQALLSI